MDVIGVVKLACTNGLRFARRLVALLGVFLAGVAGLGFALLALYWLAPESRAFAVGGLVLSSGVAFLASCLLSRVTALRGWRWGLGLTALGAAIWVACWLLSPSTVSPGNARLRSVYFGDSRPRRWSPVWLVNERDQARFGGWVLPLIDPYATPAVAKEFRTTSERLYREVASDREINRAGSVLGEAYLDLLGRGETLRHLYVYRPDIEGKLPVVVAFHGWLGNMKGQVWLWSEFAERNRCAVVMPTFRNGVWEGAEAERMLDDVLRFIDGEPDFDQRRIVVAGLSNGAWGVTAWAKRHVGRYLGLIYVVPAIQGTEDATGLPEAVGERPILVVHGEDDNRIPSECIKSWCKLMEHRGCTVERLSYPKQGHLLMATAQESFMKDVGERMTMFWVRSPLSVQTKTPRPTLPRLGR